MKIGILTFHRAINYGAVLQCFALYRYLLDLGFEVEVIDYRVDYIEKHREPFSKYLYLRISGVRGKIKYLLSSLKGYTEIVKNARNFDAFLNKNICLSTPVFNEEEVAALDYDYIVFGSDQIWNKKIANGLNKVYWGCFDSKAQFISYAASIGDLTQLNEEDKNFISRYINNFNAIGLREQDFDSWLKKELNFNDSKVVVDPTLLMTKSFYDKIAIKPKEDNYILVYALETVPGLMEFSQRIAKQLGAKIIRIRSRKGNNSDKVCEVISCISPAEYLGYIKYSKCNILASFHGTVFSTIYQKDFYLVHSPHENRAVGYLQSLDLERRVVDASADITFSKVNYESVDTKISELRQNSEVFLKNTLSK